MDVVAWSACEAQRRLSPLGSRWTHTRAVAVRAREIAAAVAPEDQPTLLAVAYLHDEQEGPRSPSRWRYADLYAAISPPRQAFADEVGITKTSAYSWLCRRRHNHDMRHTFATWSLAAGMGIFTLARRMGTSVQMIDRTYGHLAHDAEDQDRDLLDAYDSRNAAIGHAVGTPAGLERGADEDAA